MKKSIGLISASLLIMLAIIGVGLMSFYSKETYGMTAASPWLNSISFINSNVTSDDKLYFDINYEYPDELGLSFMSIILKNIDTQQKYYFSSDNLKYIDLSKSMEYLVPGNYVIDMIGLFPKDRTYEGASYFQQFGATEEGMEPNINAFDFSNQVITIEDHIHQDEAISTEIASYVMSLTTQSASIGDQVSLNIGPSTPEVNDKLENVLLSFNNNDDGSVLNVYVKSLANNPYFLIPSTATIGSYTLDYAYLTLSSGNKIHYKNDGKVIFAYTSQFNIVEKPIDSTKYIFNNEDYNSSVDSDFSKLDQDAIITVNANKNPVISKNLFETIQNTKRTLLIEYGLSQWVFSGTDITNPKSIDVSTIVENLGSSEYYNRFLKKNVSSNSAILKFSDNGELPGKVLIKLDSQFLDNVINFDDLYVYYYEEDHDQLMKIAMEVQKNDNFYEFYLNHNSKYIISPKQINSKVVSNNTEILKLNNPVQVEKNQIPIILIFSILVGIVVIVMTACFLKKKKLVKANKNSQ